jgi:hypothetical protein
VPLAAESRRLRGKTSKKRSLPENRCTMVKAAHQEPGSLFETCPLGYRVCRGLLASSALLRDEPLRSLARDLGRDRVAAGELTVAYLVTVAL